MAMRRCISIIFLLLFHLAVQAQLAEVQADYNSTGDVVFSAFNNTPAPIFLNIDFADLENTTFNEPLPYIKMLEPGFNTLFTLFRVPDEDVPRFNYQIKVFKSNPWSIADLDFPYLIPLAPGEEIQVIDLKSLTGFMGPGEPESWNATGFAVQPGQQVYASRTGTIVEVAGAKRSGDPLTWYHTWNNSITLLQADGTLICYRNVIDNTKKLKAGQKVFAGQQLGEVAPGAEQLILVIFQHSLNSNNVRYIIPTFASEGKTGILLSSESYKVVHPGEIRGMEMTSREKRKFLK